MSYYESMQKAIDYIEEHLKEKITLKEIASLTGYSIPHVYRIFGALVGYSVMEYLKRRRLSSALYDLVTTDLSITEIAFDYGYESHEVFTRTFKSIYGQPPRTLRNSVIQPIIFEKINLLSLTIKGENIMKANIICKDALTILGIKKHILGTEEKKFELIEETREEMRSKVHLVDQRLNESLFYAAYDYIPEDLDKEDDDLDYYYYYCVEVNSDHKVPEGMIKKHIPQGKYAVFNYDVKKNTLNDLKLDCSVYDYIDGIWLPESGFELSDDSDYEVINREKQHVEYYISIK